MIEKLRPVGNPLSIIAIFAALAEVAGTAVLVVVNVEIQKVFVWFVMGFPTVLILAFFATLNFNRAALYAPRDYNNDDTFLELMSRRARIQSELAAARRIASDLLKEIPLEAPAAENHAVGPEQAAPESSEADAGHKPTLARLKALAGHLDSAADTAVVIEEVAALVARRHGDAGRPQAAEHPAHRGQGPAAAAQRAADRGGNALVVQVGDRAAVLHEGGRFAEQPWRLCDDRQGQGIPQPVPVRERRFLRKAGGHRAAGFDA